MVPVLVVSRSAVASPSRTNVGDHVSIEAAGADKQGLGSATRADGEQFEQFSRTAGMRAETAFSNVIIPGGH
jgi:hypothetical protein